MKGLNLERTIDPIPESDLINQMEKHNFHKEKKEHKHTSKRFGHGLGRFRFGSKKSKSAAQQWDNLISSVNEQRLREHHKLYEDHHYARKLRKPQSESFDRQSTLTESDSTKGSDPSLQEKGIVTASVSALPDFVAMHGDAESDVSNRLRRTTSTPPEGATTSIMTGRRGRVKKVNFGWKNSVESEQSEADSDPQFTVVPSIIKQRRYVPHQNTGSEGACAHPES